VLVLVIRSYITIRCPGHYQPMPECNCSPGNREVVPTVPWQSDFCGNCGNDIAESETHEA
jgi:hypothetical protein